MSFTPIARESEVLRLGDGSSDIFLSLAQRGRRFMLKIPTARSAPQARQLIDFLKGTYFQFLAQAVRVEERADHKLLYLPYLEKGSLQSVVERSSRPLDAADTVAVVKQLCLPLSALYERNLQHGRVRPSAVMISQKNKVVLLGFQFEQASNKFCPFNAPEKLEPPPKKLAGENTTFTNLIYGKNSEDCFEEEQQRNLRTWKVDNAEFSNAADVWSLGALMLYLTTRNYPIQAHNTQQMVEQCQKLADDDSELSRQVEKMLRGSDPKFVGLVKNCLRVNPQNRISFSDLRETVDQLYTNSPLDLTKNVVTRTTEFECFAADHLQKEIRYDKNSIIVFLKASEQIEMLESRISTEISQTTDKKRAEHSTKILHKLVELEVILAYKAHICCRDLMILVFMRKNMYKNPNFCQFADTEDYRKLARYLGALEFQVRKKLFKFKEKLTKREKEKDKENGLSNYQEVMNTLEPIGLYGINRVIQRFTRELQSEPAVHRNLKCFSTLMRVVVQAKILFEAENVHPSWKCGELFRQVLRSEDPAPANKNPSGFEQDAPVHEHLQTFLFFMDQNKDWAGLLNKLQLITETANINVVDISQNKPHIGVQKATEFRRTINPGKAEDSKKAATMREFKYTFEPGNSGCED